MPFLGAYLGHLLAEISVARMHADLEIVRLAEIYATHPLLRIMPVPHVRLPDVDIEVPMLVKAVDEPCPGESPRGGASLESLRQKLNEVLFAKMAEAGLEPSPAAREAVQAAVNRRLAFYAIPLEGSRHQPQRRRGVDDC